MAVSIIQISEAAGVSKSTVSRVLNDYPRVSPEAAQAVREAVAKLGYQKPTSRVGRPRRSPTGIRTGNIAFLFPDTDPAALRTVLSGRLLHGIEQVLRNKSVSLQLSAMPAPDRLPPSIEQRQVDGVLLRGFPAEARRRAALVTGIGTLPCVHIFEPKGALPPTWDVMLEDNEAIANLAVEYLMAHGARRLAVINLFPEHPSMRHRTRSFKALAEEAGAAAQAVAADESAEALVARALDAGPIDGVFVPGPDDQVVQVYRALRARDLRPVDDVAFISCNNDPGRLAVLDPRLANIDIQPEAIGRAATEMLLSRLLQRKEPQRRMTVAPALVEPATVGATPG